jgi:hypothetical protein
MVLNVQYLWLTDYVQNWGQRKKYLTLGILSLAAFTSHCAAIGNQQGISSQADLYHKSLNDMADTVRRLTSPRRCN